MTSKEFQKNSHAPKWHCFTCLHVMGIKEYKNVIFYLIIKVFGHAAWNF